MKAIVTGGTGKCGREIVKQLLESPKFLKITVIVSKGKKREPEFWGECNDCTKLTQAEVDFDDLLSFQDVFSGFSIGICALSTTFDKEVSINDLKKVDYAYVLESATLMKKGGVKHFSIVSSMGANPNSWLIYPATKGRVEEAVKALDFERLSIFRPGFLFEPNDQTRPFELWHAYTAPSFLGVDAAQLGYAIRQNAEKEVSDKVTIFSNSAIKNVI